jgi:hypothetical protein
MTIDEAIKKMEPLTKDADWIVAADLKEAIRLGIEALKRLKDIREYRFGITDKLLPSETEVAHSSTG